MEAKYKSLSHCKVLVQYHIVWCPKYRYSVLKGDVRNGLEKCLYEICQTYCYEIKALEIMPDHIHIFLSAPQTVAPCDIVRSLKSKSAIYLFKSQPELKRFYSRCGVLWSRGYFLSTVGHVSEETIKKYIEEQSIHHGYTK